MMGAECGRANKGAAAGGDNSLAKLAGASTAGRREDSRSASARRLRFTSSDGSVSAPIGGAGGASRHQTGLGSVCRSGSIRTGRRPPIRLCDLGIWRLHIVASSLVSCRTIGPKRPCGVLVRARPVSGRASGRSLAMN
jgi:hypothetical protein